MKFHIPDKHMTISNGLLTLCAIALLGGSVVNIAQTLIAILITVAVVLIISLGLYALIECIRHEPLLRRYDFDEPQQRTIEHHHYIHNEQSQQRTIEQQPKRYTVLPQPEQRVMLPAQQKRLK